MISNNTDSNSTPTILIADDDRSMRSLLNLAISEEGYQVIQTKNGEQCLAEYTRLQPDLILLDAMMPDMDGLTCCDRIRQLPKGNQIPILMITVLDDHESIEKAFAAGITDYITKPINWTVLVQRVRHLLMMSQALVSAELATQKLQQQSAWEHLLRKILQQLSLSSVIEDRLPTILSYLQSFFEVERVVLVRCDKIIESVETGFDSSEALFSENLLSFLKSQSVQSSQQMQIIGIETLDRSNLSAAASSQLNELKNQALLTVPLIGHNQTKGWLCLHDARHLTQNHELNQKRLSDLAQLLAIAIN